MSGDNICPYGQANCLGGALCVCGMLSGPTHLCDWLELPLPTCASCGRPPGMHVDDCINNNGQFGYIKPRHRNT